MRRLKVSGGRIKKSIIGVALALILANFVPFFKAAYAYGPTTNVGDYASINVRGATGFTGTGNGTTFTYNGGTVTFSGATDPMADTNPNHNYGDHTGDMHILYTKSSSVTFTANPANNHFAEARINGQLVSLTNNSYAMSNLQARGDNNPGYQGYEIDFSFPESNNQPQPPQPGNTQATFNYTYSSSITDGPEEDKMVEFSINEHRVDVWGQNYTDVSGGKQASFTDTYNSGSTDTTVEFRFETLFIYVADSISINGNACALPSTKEQFINNYHNQHNTVTCAVAKANTYNIVTHTRKAAGENELFMGNFLWDNDDNSTTAVGDDIIGHGSLEFVSVKYNGVTYNSVEELNAANNLHFEYSNSNVPGNTDGGMALPVGAELTIRLIPEPGYQLVSFGINGGEFDPQENIGEYTFEIKPGNGHLAANFAAVDDEVVADADAIESGSITLGGAEGSIDMGTAKLSVDNVELEPADIDGFNNAAGDYKVSTFLDISLYKTVYKGSLVDSWDEKIDELENEATITLTLEEGIDGNEVVIVHQKHDGTYEVIPSVYDPVARTVTFKTSSFSNYAIASRTVAAPDTGANVAGTTSAKLTSIGTFIAVLTIVSIIYIATQYLALEKQNRK